MTYLKSKRYAGIDSVKKMPASISRTNAKRKYENSPPVEYTTNVEKALKVAGLL